MSSEPVRDGEDVTATEREPWTVGQLRELCADLSDDVLIDVIVPIGNDEGWRAVGFDISAHLFPTRRLVIDIEEAHAPHIHTWNVMGRCTHCDAEEATDG